MTETAPAHSGKTKIQTPKSVRVYIGTYAPDTSPGIFVYQMDTATGKLTPESNVSGVANPSFLAIAPNHKFLYSVGETGNFHGEKAGAVAAFSIDPASGGLTLLNQESSHGTDPCHITLDTIGKNALVANYSSGSIAVLPIASDGTLKPASTFLQHTGSGPDKGRQEGPHAHSIYTDKSDRFVYSADLGNDKVLVYHFDVDKGTLTPADPPSASVPPGSGPRHLAFAPNGKHAYAINEMKSTVTVFEWDEAHGKLKPTETVSTLPHGFKGASTTAEVFLSPDGKFLYGSNRGHDSIAIFSVNPSNGKLTVVDWESTQGKTPRGFRIDPTGNFLLAGNQESDSVVVFRIDKATGKLKATGETASIPKPVSIEMIPIEAP